MITACILLWRELGRHHRNLYLKFEQVFFSCVDKGVAFELSSVWMMRRIILHIDLWQIQGADNSKSGLAQFLQGSAGWILGLCGQFNLYFSSSWILWVLQKLLLKELYLNLTSLPQAGWETFSSSRARSPFVLGTCQRCIWEVKITNKLCTRALKL